MVPGPPAGNDTAGGVMDDVVEGFAAVEHYRRLATADPEAHELDLAMALNDLGIQLAELGRREEAVAATGEAADTFRRLAQDRPTVFEPHLATVAYDLGNWLAELG